CSAIDNKKVDTKLFCAVPLQQTFKIVLFCSGFVLLRETSAILAYCTLRVIILLLILSSPMHPRNSRIHRLIQKI
ncbi:hypothetical protein T265_03118, partial [Opisthorchis viverrini]